MALTLDSTRFVCHSWPPLSQQGGHAEGPNLPYVNVQLTGDRLAAEQKLELIQRITKVFVDVLGKEPATTFIVIQEIDPENWGVHGTSVALRREARARGEKV